MFRLLFCVLITIFTASLTYSQRISSLESELKSASDSSKVRILMELSQEYQKTEFSKAAKYAKQAAEMANQTGEKPLIAKAAKQLAAVQFDSGEFIQAESLAQDAILKIKAAEYPDQIFDLAKTTNLIGLCEMEFGNYKKAESYYREAASLYANIQHLRGQASALHNIGVVNYYQSKLDSCMKYYFLALKFSEQAKTEDLSVLITNNIGLLYSKFQDYEKAIEYQKKAIPFYEQRGDSANLAPVYAGIGTVFYNWGKMDSSQMYHEKALQLFRKTGDLRGSSQELLNLTQIFLFRKQCLLASKYSTEAMEIQQKIGHTYGLALSYRNQAQIEDCLGNLDAAKVYFEKSIESARSIKANWLISDIYMSYAYFWESHKNYEKAYNYFQLHSQMKDTIFSEQKTEALLNLQTQYETEQKEKDLIIKNSQIEKLEYEKQLTRIAGLAVLMILAFGAGWAYSVFQKRQLQHKIALEIAEKTRELAESKQKQSETELEFTKIQQEKVLAELEFKKKELTQFALHINLQNEFLESLHAKIRQFENQEIRTIEKELSSQINLEKQRETFETNIDLINSDFYQKLILQFPQLTESEKKLCAMLRLGLSSKEIASIQNISPKSVDMNRYRLRKKLNIQTEEDLSQFFAKI